MSRDEQFYLVIQATEKMSAYLKKQELKVGLILIKDFFTEDTPSTGEYHQGFTKFTVQPKMILDLNPAWKTFDDYLDSMKSKYRVRARKALQKASEIQKIVFDAEQIAGHRDVIHSLYKNISDQADFNAFVLHENYFENLKATLGKNMTFTTYWKDNKMVAFFTSIKNFDMLDAHFLGYDPNENIECQLYLNMLLDLIKEGLNAKVSKIDMSRTAVEIKFTVGAVPHNMYLYLRHTNTFLNKSVETAASLVVFLVAVPLCLGIALASGAPLISGLIAGIIGGIVVGLISGSNLGVSGPAAGLAAIVLGSITQLGSFPLFLTAVVLAGLIQIALGFLRAGVIAYYFPNSVIKGMLAGIGVIIILKQIPHAVGDDKDWMGDMGFDQSDKLNTFQELGYALQDSTLRAVLFTGACLAVLLLWDLPFIRRVKGLSLGFKLRCVVKCFGQR